jgi:hypothetical protein
VWRVERSAQSVPAGLLDDVNDRLATEYWTQPPMFVATIDPAAVRTMLRRLGYDRRALGEVQARAVGTQLDADFAVVAYLTRCGYDRRDKPASYTVATRDGTGAQILVYSQRVLEVTCMFRVVRVESGKVVAEGTMDTGAARRLRHATYGGDMRKLLLSQKEHAWFDKKRRANVDRELERETATQLSEALAGAVYTEVTKLLP